MQADVSENSHFWAEHQNPLRMIVRLENLNMCRLLVEIDHVNPLSALTCDLNKQMILKNVSSIDEKITSAILRLLSRHAYMIFTLTERQHAE